LHVFQNLSFLIILTAFGPSWRQEGAQSGPRRLQNSIFKEIFTILGSIFEGFRKISKLIFSLLGVLPHHLIEVFPIELAALMSATHKDLDIMLYFKRHRDQPSLVSASLFLRKRTNSIGEGRAPTGLRGSITKFIGGKSGMGLI